MKHYYETVIIWEGQLFAHTCATIPDAIEWAKQYPLKAGDCFPRIFRLKSGG